MLRRSASSWCRGRGWFSPFRLHLIALPREPRLRWERLNVRSTARRVLSSALLMSALPVVAATPSRAAREVHVVALPGGEGLGEISQYTADGRLLARWTGFSDIESIQITGSSRLIVFEQGRKRFVEFDRSGVVYRSGSLQPASVFQGVVLPNGHLLLAAGTEGAIELDTSGGIVWRASLTDPAAEVVSAARLADGTTLCAARFAPAPLYQAPAGSTRFLPVNLPEVDPFRDRWQRPRLRVVDSVAQQVALWYSPWRSWYEFQWKSGSLERRSTFPAKGSVSAVAPGTGRSAWVAEDQFAVIQSSSSGAEIGWFAVADGIRDLAGGEGSSVFVAVERTPDFSRPAHRPPPPGHNPFSWGRLGLWLVGSVLFVGILQVITWRTTGHEAAPVAIPAEPSPGVRESTARPRAWPWIPVAAVAIGGLVMAGAGSVLLRQDASRRAILLLLAGTLLAALAGQWWSRATGGGVNRWWVNALGARFPPWLLLPTLCIAAALLPAGLVLWRWQARGVHPNDSISLWVSLEFLCVGLLVLSRRPPRAMQFRVPWETLLHVAVLLLLAWIILSHDLGGVPQNVHNDVGMTVEYSLRLLEGRADGFFSSGYAQIPYPGHLPTALGLRIAGKTVTGSRWGGMLIGFLAVLGTYALGREYRSARLGLFASILLLASIPFLHFSRSTPFGEVAAYSVWFLYVLLRAVRTAHPGWWLLCGVIGGWGLFLFYSARVALVGVIIAGIFLSLRSYRVTLCRWYGPPLFVLGFAVTVVPMAPYWRSNPQALAHRMDTSFSLYDPRTGFHREVLARALGKPFLKTLGMFYTETDASGQGTLSPAEGPIEAALLSVGLAVALTDGWGTNVACLAWFLTMLLGCGAFAEATPWYTRLVPVTPVVSLLIARALDLQVDLLTWKRPAFKRVLVAAVSAALVFLAAKNLKTYVNFERSRSSTIFTAFGRAALPLGPRYEFYCVSFQRPDFSCLHPAFLPYFANLDVHDLHDPFRAMPFPARRPIAIMIPFERFVSHPLDPRVLVAEIVRGNPAAKVQSVYAGQERSGPPIGMMVVLSPGSQGDPESEPSAVRRGPLGSPQSRDEMQGIVEDFTRADVDRGAGGLHQTSGSSPISARKAWGILPLPV